MALLQLWKRWLTFCLFFLTVELLAAKRKRPHPPFCLWPCCGPSLQFKIRCCIKSFRMTTYTSLVLLLAVACLTRLSLGAGRRNRRSQRHVLDALRDAVEAGAGKGMPVNFAPAPVVAVANVPSPHSCISCFVSRTFARFGCTCWHYGADGRVRARLHWLAISLGPAGFKRTSDLKLRLCSAMLRQPQCSDARSVSRWKPLGRRLPSRTDVRLVRRLNGTLLPFQLRLR